MDQAMAEVSEGEVKVGDKVELFGPSLPVDELAFLADTINYELVCLVGKRVPRIYYKDGKIYNVLNFIVKEN